LIAMPANVMVNPRASITVQNSAWFLWQRSSLRIYHPPAILYSPARQISI
jgi:hypothetical protein